MTLLTKFRPQNFPILILFLKYIYEFGENNIYDIVLSFIILRNCRMKENCWQSHHIAKPFSRKWGISLKNWSGKSSQKQLVSSLFRFSSSVVQFEIEWWRSSLKFILQSADQTSSKRAIEWMFYWVGEIETIWRHKIRWNISVYRINVKILKLG